MNVLLLQTVKGLGTAGTIVSASDGYARNFLFPNQLAKPATKDAIEQAHEHAQKQKRDVQKSKKEEQRIITALHGQHIFIKAKANEQGLLYAAISMEQLQQQIRSLVIVPIEAKHIILTEPIKSCGDHTMFVHRPYGLVATLTVHVTRE